MGIRTFFSSLFCSAPVVVSYEACTDEEVLELSATLDQLTPAAREVLLAELARRDLEPAEPAEVAQEVELTPFLKRDIREAGKCGCKSGGCHGK